MFSFCVSFLFAVRFNLPIYSAVGICYHAVCNTNSSVKERLRASGLYTFIHTFINYLDHMKTSFHKLLK